MGDGTPYACAACRLRSHLRCEEFRRAPCCDEASFPDVPPDVLQRVLRDQPVDGSGLAGRPEPGDRQVGEAAGNLRATGPSSGRHRTASRAAGHGLCGKRSLRCGWSCVRRAVPQSGAGRRGSCVPVLVRVRWVRGRPHAEARERRRGRLHRGRRLDPRGGRAFVQITPLTWRLRNTSGAPSCR